MTRSMKKAAPVFAGWLPFFWNCGILCFFRPDLYAYVNPETVVFVGVNGELKAFEAGGEIEYALVSEGERFAGDDKPRFFALD